MEFRLLPVKLTDLSIWNANAKEIHVFVKSTSIIGIQQHLSELNIQYEVIVENYQRIIDEESVAQEEIQYLRRDRGT